MSKVFADEVRDKTGGKITFDIHESSSLVPADEMLDAVSTGLVDIGYLTASVHPQELPLTDRLTVLGSLPENSFPAGILQAAAAQQETYTNYGDLALEYEKNNLKFLTAQYIGTSYDMMCTKEIDSAADARGLRVRAPGKIWEDEAKALGMVPVSLPAVELYEGLQRGVVDCAILVPTGYYALGLSEVAKHYYPTVFTTLMSNPIVMNLDRWNSLPRDAQDVIEGATHTLWSTFLDTFIKDHKRFADRATGEHDVLFHDTRSLDAILADHQERAIADFRREPSNQPLYEQFAGSLDRWKKIVVELGYEFGSDSTRTPERILKAYQSAGDLKLGPFFGKAKSELFDPSAS
ncbi:hypothetical protein BAY60_19535 [Prauserella muralis]|uniref:TRAP-type C4-dicarboxylate transport system substrate-binding protein n=2 Tax=Prauserella muralis TaxID=588067 RepID=A0A2V4ATT7_9PSEU|nr:hypothetical protein BAY60_19535 [Prauserella muralis]